MSNMVTRDEFLKIFVEHNKYVYTFIYYKVNQQKELAEDLAQEVFIKAWNKIDTFDEEKSSIKTWFVTIARNHCIDFFRSNKITYQLDTEVHGEIKDDTELLEHKISLEIALKNLSESDRELITLRYIQGNDYIEIAEIMGKTYIATKTACSRALQKLKIILKND